MTIYIIKYQEVFDDDFNCDVNAYTTKEARDKAFKEKVEGLEEFICDQYDRKFDFKDSPYYDKNYAYRVTSGEFYFSNCMSNESYECKKDDIELEGPDGDTKPIWEI